MVPCEISGIQLAISVSSVSNVTTVKNLSDGDVFQGIFLKSSDIFTHTTE